MGLKNISWSLPNFMKSQKSYIPKKIIRVWLEIDASAKPLGRVATVIANALRGKVKRFYPHLDMVILLLLQMLRTSNLQDAK